MPSPKIAFESTEWLDYRVLDADRNDLPRVLLIGDSISGHYFYELAGALKGKAYVARLGSSAVVCLPTYLKEIEFAISQHPYAVIHFNNGLHGWAYSEDEYAQGLRQLVTFLKAKAPQAKLIWASSTPMREGTDFLQMHPDNQRVIARNQIAAELMASENISINDLYTLMVADPALTNDGIHYHQKGAALLTSQVAPLIENLLPKK